jgi:hypothetical protein
MVETPFPSLLAKLDENAARLNAASDSLNLILTTVEQRLAQANVGVEVWLRQALASTEAEGSTGGETTWTAQFLGFAKVNGQWTLAIKSTRFVSGFFEGDTSCPYRNGYKDGEPIRLAKASRELRIQALEHVPALIELLSQEANRCIETIDNAKRLVIEV